MPWTGNYDAFGTSFPNAVADTQYWQIDQFSNQATVTVKVWASESARVAKKPEIGNHQYLWIEGGQTEITEPPEEARPFIPDYNDFFGQALSDPTYNVVQAVVGHILSQSEWAGWVMY